MLSRTTRIFRRKKSSSSKKACDAHQLLCKNNSLPLDSDDGGEQFQFIGKTLSAGDASVLEMVEETPDAEYAQPDVCKNNSSGTESDMTMSEGPSASGEEIAQMPSSVSNGIFESDEEEEVDDLDDAKESDEHYITEEMVEVATEALVSAADEDGEPITDDETPMSEVVEKSHVAGPVVDSSVETKQDSDEFPTLEALMLERVNNINQIKKMLRQEFKLDNDMMAEFTEVITVQNETIENMNTYNEEQRNQFHKEIEDMKVVAAEKDASLADAVALIASLKSKVDEGIESIQSLECDLHTARDEMTQMQSAHEEQLRKMIEEKTADLTKNTDSIAELERIVQEEKTSNESLKQKLSAALHEITKLEEIKIKLEEEKSKMQAEFEGCRANNDAALAKAAVDIATLEKTVEEEQGSIKSLQDSLTAARNELAKMQTAKENLKSKLNEEKSTNKALKDDNAGLAEGIAALTKSVKDLKKEKSTAEEKIASESKKVETLKKDMKNAMKLVAKLQEVEKDLQTKLDDEQQTTKGLRDDNDALQEEMDDMQRAITSVQGAAQAKADQLARDNAALVDSVDKLKQEKAIADEKAKAQMKKNDELRNDLKQSTKVMTNMSSGERAIKTELSQAKKSIKELRSDNATLKKANIALTKEVDELKNGTSGADEKIESKMKKMKADLIAASEVMSALSASEKKLKEKIKAMEKEMAAKEKERVMQMKEVAKLKAELQAANQSLSSVSDEESVNAILQSFKDKY